MAAKSSSNEIQIIRVYDAPVRAVWDAWTDPEQVAKWWGPRGFTLTTHSKELKPGGIWHYTMHGPDGTDYPNKTLYHEVVEHSKLVYDHGGNDERAPMFRVTVVFTEVSGKTKMDMKMTLPTPEAAEETRKFIKKAGGDSTWDRLAEYMERESSGKEKFVINRTFDAPLDAVFELWSNPKHLSQWLPPPGFTMQFLRPDIEQGRSAFFCMSGGEEIKLYVRTEYLVIERPIRIIYTQQFCDEQENLSRHPMAPSWPATMLMTVEFAADGETRTRVTVSTEAYGDATSEELASFVASKGGMTQGWSASFDSLDAHLESAART